jgi:hypothetical protein
MICGRNRFMYDVRITCFRLIGEVVDTARAFECRHRGGGKRNWASRCTCTALVLQGVINKTIQYTLLDVIQ